MRRFGTAAPPVVALLLIVLAVVLPDPRNDARPPTPVPVGRATYACPGGTHVMMGQVNPAESVEVTAVPDGKRQRTLERPNRWREADPADGSLIVDQVGRRSGAAGFFAAADENGSLVVGSCPATVDQQWYLGLGSGAKHESRILLTNLSNVLAVADLAMWGRQGPIEEVGARGLVIRPGQVKVVDLKTLAAGEPDVELRVNRRRGALSVATLDASAQVFSGTEAIPSTGIPARWQVIAGIPAKAKGRSLVFLNPGTQTSRVEATILGADGPVVPQQLASIRVRAGSTVTMDMPPGIGADGLSVRVTSDQPVVAGARFEFSKQDFATAVVSRPLDGPVLMPVTVGKGVDRPQLTVTAVGKRARVDVIGYDSAMKPTGRTSAVIAATTTSTVKLNALGNAAYAVVRPHGSVVGAALYTSESGIASMPLQSAPLRVLGPDVRSAS